MLKTFKSLLVYIWPANRNDIKFRIILAIFILIIAKVLTVLVPYTYKWATDGIVGNNSMPNLISVAVITPIFLIISIGVGRVLMMAFNQLRDALFA